MDSHSDPLKVRTQGDITVARIQITNLMGLLDVGRLQQQFDDMIASGVRKLVIDLKHVKFAASASLGMLLAVHKKLKSLNGRLVLAHTESLTSLLKISRTDRMFELAPDLKSAVAMLS